MILLLDNFDSFTYNLVDYFAQLGVDCDVKRNDTSLQDIISKEYQAIVLSPGPETPAKAGIMMEVLDHYIGLVPILGICLGHQAIGEYFGANLVKSQKPMHGKVSGIYCEEHQMYKRVPKQHKVVRYNSLLIENIKEPLRVIAKTSTNEVMAIAHNSLPIWGLQYHPEAALSEYGIQTLQNWVAANSVVVNE